VRYLRIRPISGFGVKRILPGRRKMSGYGPKRKRREHMTRVCYQNIVARSGALCLTRTGKQQRA
jgi:hypothetical protein